MQRSHEQPHTGQLTQQITIAHRDDPGGAQGSCMLGTAASRTDRAMLQAVLINHHTLQLLNVCYAQLLNVCYTQR